MKKLFDCVIIDNVTLFNGVWLDKDNVKIAI